MTRLRAALAARCLAIGCLVALLPPLARAAPSASTGIVADRFAPGVGPDALLGGEGAQVTPAGQLSWSLSLGGLGDPIRLKNAFTGSGLSEPVRAQVAFDLALELGVWRRIAVAVGVPIVLWQDGDRLDATGLDQRRLGAPTGGDLRVRLKVAVAADPARPGLHVAALVQLTAPLGGQEQFAATDGVTVEPRLIADLRVGRFLVAAALGVRFGPERQLFFTHLGDELTWTLSARYLLAAGARLGAGLVVEAAGGVGADPGTRPVELRGALSLGRDSIELALGGGGGVSDGVGAPSWRGFALVRGRFAAWR